MKRLPFLLFIAFVGAIVFSACNSDDDNWSKYEDWRNANTAYFTTQRDSLDANGNLYYQVVYPDWNPRAEILVHYFNDRSETKDNLSPLLTSTCDFIYYGQLMTATPFDSSYLQTAYGRGIYRARPSQMISGFGIALMDMHVGDSCEILIPYNLAYGSASKGLILPYSTLRFNIGLKDISAYEIPEAQ